VYIFSCVLCVYAREINAAELIVCNSITIRYQWGAVGSEYCDDGIPVCLSASISPELPIYVTKFLCIQATYSGGSSGGIAIRYALRFYG